MTAEWVCRQMTAAGRIGAAALCRLLSRRLSRLDPRRFVCRAEEVLDETCPQFEDRYLYIRMKGRIPASESNIDTDVRIELCDITDGAASPEPVLSAAPQWRHPESPVFFYQAHNGAIPAPNAVLVADVIAAKIPLHLLRFARRGRRRIQATVEIVDRRDGRPLVRADDCFEYVFCGEGFVELQQRRESVLKACVELACAVASVASAEESPLADIAEIIGGWVQNKVRHFTPRSNPAEPLDRLGTAADAIDIDAACECLLAWGQKTDRIAAAELALQVAALFPSLTNRQEEILWTMAETLRVSPERFLVLCQKRLLTDPVRVEQWPLLLGIRKMTAPEALRQRLNEEYRKWNARVTHPDPRIRRQADLFLSLIAEIRIQQHNEMPVQSASPGR